MSLFEVNKIAFNYPRQRPVFDEVSFDVQAGEILTFLGPNGVGKSTLLECLLGFKRVTAGSIYLNGKQLSRLSRRSIAQQVAYVPQNYQVTTSLSVSDYLLTARSPYMHPLQTPGQADNQLVQECLDKFGLSSLSSRALSSLSGGQQQIIAIAKALIQKPQLLILDEPTAALDLKRQREVLMILKKLASQGIAVILTTHLPDQAFLLDSKVGLFFPGGKLVVGDRPLLMTEENLEKIYQTPLELSYVPNLKRYTCQFKL